MKKILITLILMLVIYAYPAITDSSEDYKVIKNAVKQSEAFEWQKDLHGNWLNFTIHETDSGKLKMKAAINLDMVKAILGVCREGIKIHEHDFHRDVDIRKVIETLEKSGSQSLIYIEDLEENETIKFWIEKR